MDATARRVGADRWFMLSRSNANDRVQALLDRYQRAEPFVSGWRISASRGGQERIAELPLSTVIRRAVRCLFTEVGSQTGLATAINALESNNWGLPINRLHPLSNISALPRARWLCVDQYPEQNPACPFCGGQQFKWIDGDDCVYSGDGSCKGCGAEISIHDYLRPR